MQPSPGTQLDPVVVPLQEEAVFGLGADNNQVFIHWHPERLDVRQQESKWDLRHSHEITPCSVEVELRISKPLREGVQPGVHKRSEVVPFSVLDRTAHALDGALNERIAFLHREKIVFAKTPPRRSLEPRHEVRSQSASFFGPSALLVRAQPLREVVRHAPILETAFYVLACASVAE